MSQKPLSILISGVGVAGTTLALSLARHPSFQPRPVVTLIERSPIPRTTGQAIDIRGPGVRLLHKLGIEEKVKARHTTETGIAFIGSDGKDVAKFDKTENPEKQSATSEYEILRGELVGLLLEELEEAKKTTGTEVTTIYGEHIASLTEEEDGVTVTFTNGKLPSQKYDVVIAADGVNSRTRSMIFPNLKSEECIEPWGLYMAYFSIPRIEGDTSQWRWFHAPGGLGVHMRPHRNPSTVGVYLSMCMPKRERSPELDPILSQGAEAQKPILRERFKNIGWQEERILSEMERSSDFYMHHVCRVETPTWATRRCAIMGDAAHATMGIGTSNAMIGGYIIAGELAKVTTNSAEEIGAALKRYQDGLRPIAGGDNSKPPPGFPQMGNPQTWWGVGVMHTIIRMVAFTKLDRLFAGLGETDEGKWKLPEYGFP